MLALYFLIQLFTFLKKSFFHVYLIKKQNNPHNFLLLIFCCTNTDKFILQMFLNTSPMPNTILDIVSNPLGKRKGRSTRLYRVLVPFLRFFKK